MQQSPPKHRHDGTSPLPLGMDWSPAPRHWNGRDTIWPHDHRTGWSYCISIPSWVVRPKSRDSDPVVFYRVQVGIQSPEGITTTRGVLRRFNDFLKLATVLKGAFPKKKLPLAPPKGLLRVKSRSLLEERRHSLEDWMTMLLSDIDLSRSVPVASFLELEAAARSSFLDENQTAVESHTLEDGCASPLQVPSSSASVYAGGTPLTSDNGSDTAYETSEIGTPSLGMDNGSEIGTDDLSLYEDLTSPIEKLVKYGMSNIDEGLSMGHALLEQLEGLPKHKLHSGEINGVIGYNSKENGKSSKSAYLADKKMELFSEAKQGTVLGHVRKLSTESAGREVSSFKDNGLTDVPFQSPFVVSLDHPGTSEISRAEEVHRNTEVQTSGAQLVLSSDQRHKMNMVLTTMQRRLITARTDMEDLISRLNQETAVKDYLATRVKDLEVELETTTQKSKENLQQAILLERERVTQMQWDMEELRRKSFEMELQLKSKQVEKLDIESTTGSAEEESSLLQELDETKKQLEDLLKQHQELQVRSKADIKVLGKEVKNLRNSHAELKRQLIQSQKEKSEAERLLHLDKNLQQEQKHCLEELQCNIVVMKSSKPMVLRLNLSSDEPQTPFYSAAGSPTSYIEDIHGQNLKHSTPVTSPEEPSTSYTQTTQESSKSSPDSVTSPYIAYEKNPLSKGLNKGNYNPSSDQNKNNNLRTRPKSSATSDHKTVFYIAQNHSTIEKSPTGANYQNTNKINSSIIRYNQDTVGGLGLNQICESGYLHGSSIRQAMSLGKNSSIPPPLCSLCKHKAPAFGKPLKQFDYEELIEVTDGFSNINFLAEGRFGKVYRGVLRDGQVVAVKKLKFVGSQGDADFCREVCVLSCAQHRNVVLLIGFCVEGKTRLLVYEYICDGSLDFHLHGNKRTPLDWQCRQKIAIGAARGLRYLHEDCRVGCIIHRDMRPSNVLLTHDHEPLVADIGLARLHNDSVICEERVFGTIGYLAPEYFNCGEITEKADIYAFGLILLELITGRKIIDLQLEPAEVLVNIYQLLDPCLSHYQFPELPLEVQAMSHVAFLCLQQDPESRPPMSKVLRILEGADVGIALRLDLNATGSRSGHMKGLRTKAPLEQRRHSRNFSH